MHYFLLYGTLAKMGSHQNFNTNTTVKFISMKYMLLFVICTLHIELFAQTPFIYKGKVEYEKKTNQHKLIEDEAENIWYQEMMKTLPKFTTDHYELIFNSKQSAYKLIKENPDNKYVLFGSKPSETDIILADLQTGLMSSQKDIFENTYLINDSLHNTNWKITLETREIAGFECRKAITKICDSVYIVAFYTDQIPVAMGPESFGGLPGLILGLAVPRLYTTWFATKLELIDPNVNQLNSSLKGKKVNRMQVLNEMKKGMKDWGKEGVKRVWMSQL